MYQNIEVMLAKTINDLLLAVDYGYAYVLILVDSGTHVALSALIF